MPRKKEENLENYDELEKELKDQLITNNNYNKVTKELVEKYIKYTKIEDKLIKDIDKRGVNVTWNNGGGQKGVKRNDSIQESTKVNAQKLKILDKLGIKPPETKADGDEDYEV